MGKRGGGQRPATPWVGGKGRTRSVPGAIDNGSRTKRAGENFCNNHTSLTGFLTKEAAMFLPKSDIFKDIRQEAISEISEIAFEEKHEKGAILFREGDAARYFYVLVEGKVLLTIDDAATPHYVATKIGELFGWSSAVGRDFYSATAECLVPTTVMKIDRVDLDQVFDEHPRSGKVFYKLLAEALGQRWVDLQRTWISELDRERKAS